MHKLDIENRAVCACGWRAEKVHTGEKATQSAILDYAAHARACREAGK